MEKTTASTETPRPEAKAQGPGRGLSLLTLLPEQNKHAAMPLVIVLTFDRKRPVGWSWATGITTDIQIYSSK